jgi:NAD(P)H-dependent FMN reductase
MKKLSIKLIVGSTRPGRFSEHLVPWILDSIEKKENLEVEVLDLRDFDLPFFNEPKSPINFGGTYPSEVVELWAKKIIDADGYIVIAPEYNHGYSSVLKNAFDYLYHEWNNKPIAFVAYGTVGGARSVEQLRQVAIELQMAPIRNSVHINAPWTLREENGALKEGVLEGHTNSLHGLLDQLIWWGTALKRAREKNEK